MPIKRRRTLALIEQVGSEVRFLPADSPGLNPIEMMWSKVNAFLRKAQARNPADLLAAIAIPRSVCPRYPRPPAPWVQSRDASYFEVEIC